PSAADRLAALRRNSGGQRRRRRERLRRGQRRQPLSEPLRLPHDRAAGRRRGGTHRAAPGRDGAAGGGGMSPEINAEGPGVRRIEAPVLGHRRGAAWTPGLIDVSWRYGDRTLLAESPPQGLPPDLARSLHAAASRLAWARRAAGAFTVSFLADPAGGEHHFLGTAPGLPQDVA